MKISTFAPEFFAQVAELVDALDSKSSVLNRRAGSIPALSTKNLLILMIKRFFIFYFPKPTLIFPFPYSRHVVMLNNSELLVHYAICVCALC